MYSSTKHYYAMSSRDATASKPRRASGSNGIPTFLGGVVMDHAVTMPGRTKQKKARLYK